MTDYMKNFQDSQLDVIEKKYGIKNSSLEKYFNIAQDKSIKCLAQAVLREEIININNFAIRHESNFIIPLWENKDFLYIDTNNKVSLNRFPHISDVSIKRNGKKNTIKTPNEFINALIKTESMSFCKNGISQLMIETNNSVKNNALSLAYKYNWNKSILKELDKTKEEYFFTWVIKNYKDCSLFFEQWGSEGHPYHPGSKTKLGFNTLEVLKYSPEFEGGAKIKLLAIKKSLLNIHSISQSFDIEDFFNIHFKNEYKLWKKFLKDQNLNINDFYLIPTHPWQLENSISKKFKTFLNNKQIIITPITFDSKATMSFRTVVKNNVHIKLPVAIQATSAIRTVSPASVKIGPQMSNILLSIEKNDLLIQKYFKTVPEYFGMHFNIGSSDEQKHLSVIYRGNPTNLAKNNEYPVTVASLFQLSPKNNSPLIIELIKLSDMDSKNGILNYFYTYSEIVINAYLRLYLKYGISLEAHQQNTLMLFNSSGIPKKVLSRDFGGVRVHRPTLKKAGYNIEPIKNAVTIRDDKDEVRNKLLYTTYQSHLGELILLLSKEFNIEENLFWDILLSLSNECFLKHSNELEKDIYLEELSKFFHEDWNLKSLTKMRLDNTSHDYIYTKLNNPMKI